MYCYNISGLNCLYIFLEAFLALKLQFLKHYNCVTQRQNLLFSAKKREAYLMEMKRLREGTGCMLPYPGLLGSLVAADMRLPLKPEFMAKLGTSHGRLCACFISCYCSVI